MEGPWHSGGGGGSVGPAGTTGAWGAAVEKTIAAGIATLAGEGIYLIDTQDNDAADDLIQLLGLEVGDEVVISPAHADRTVTVKVGANMLIREDFVMNNIADQMRLICTSAGVCREAGSRSSAGA